MSWQAKYTTSFKDRYGRSIQVDLEKDGWSGGATTIVCVGVEIEWQCSHPLQILRGSAAYIRLIESSGGQFDEFFDISQNEVRVKITLASSDYWYGFVLAGDYQRQYISNNFVVVTAVDGIGLLRGVPYLNSGSPYSGRTRVWTTINNALQKTGLNLTYIERVNIFEDSMTSGAGHSPLYQSYIDADMFYDRETLAADSCYDVIEKCLKPFNCSIHQEDAKWYISRIPELAASCDYRAVNTSGTVTASGSSDYYKALSTINAADADFLRFVYDNAIVKANQVKRSLTLGLLFDKNIIMDSFFEEAAATTTYWTAVSGCVSAFATGQNEGRCMKLTATAGDYMEYTDTYGGTVAVTGNAGRFHITGKMKVQETSTGTAPFSCDGIQVYLSSGTSYYNDSDGNWITSGYAFTTLEDDVWTDIDIYTDTVPAGSYEVKIRLHARVAGLSGYVYYDDVQVVYLNTYKEKDNYISEHTIDEDNIYGENASEELAVIDSFVGNTQHLWKNTLSLGSEAIANTWGIGNGYSKNLWRFFKDVFIATYMRPARVYQGVLLGQFNYYKALSDGTRRYQATRMLYNMEASTWDGELVELNYPGYADEEVTDFTNGAGAYAFTSFTDNGDLTFDASYDNSANGSPITKTSVLNTITCDDYYKYKITLSITDNGSSSAQIDFVWDAQSETAISDGDVFYMDFESVPSAPYVRVVIAPSSTADFTIGVNMEKYYGL